MTEQPREDSDVLRTVRSRRDELQRVLVSLEQALAAPARSRAAAWADRVRSEAGRLRDAFAEHVQITERPGGLHDEMRMEAPRLASRIDGLRSEHEEITSQIADATVELDAADDELAERAAQVRELLLGLISAISRHRQQGADLVYEAYEVDIGGES